MIKTFVPYAAALRVFLEQRKLITPGESVIVVDACGEKLFLTAMCAASPALTRVIPLAEAARIMEEVRRTQRNVVEKDGKVRRSQAMRVLSNHPGLAEAVFFEASFPVFEVLGQVRFPSQLMPPEDVARVKRRKLYQDLSMTGVISLVLAGAGLGFLVYARGQATMERSHIERLMAEKIEVTKELSRVGTLTYQDRLTSLPRSMFADIADTFMRYVLKGARVDTFLFERGVDMDWDFTGTIFFPRQEIFPFVQEGVFSAAQVQDIFVQGKPGQRIHINVGAVHEPPVLFLRGGEEVE